MCNRYISPSQGDIERAWHIGRQNPPRWWEGGGVYPRTPGAFVRRARHEADYSRELAVGRWGLIPWFSKTADIKFATNNARSEELASKATFKHPWARGQRCIIPAVTFDEPNWESGKNAWWSFRRTDGDLWGLAGLWNVWKHPATGEEVESYTMLTVNADLHPLMRRMHKPDPKLGPDAQDKRSVIPIEQADIDQWLAGTMQEASELLRVPPVEVFKAGPSSAAGSSVAALYPGVVPR
jgi:putative SOS response-associated peptidase YedK